jgi:hypothetical protein
MLVTDEAKRRRFRTSRMAFPIPSANLHRGGSSATGWPSTRHHGLGRSLRIAGQEVSRTREWVIAATHQVPCFYVPYEKIKKNAASNSLFQWLARIAILKRQVLWNR